MTQPPTTVGPRPVPVGVRRGVITAAYALTVITAAANFDHARSLALFAGQKTGGAILAAAVPDVLLAVSITVLTFRPRLVWAWAALFASIGFVFWAAVVTSLAGFCLPTEDTCTGAEPSNTTRILVAVWPLVAAVLLAGIVATFAHRPTPAIPIPVDKAAEQEHAWRALRPPVPALAYSAPSAPTERTPDALRAPDASPPDAEADAPGVHLGRIPLDASHPERVHPVPAFGPAPTTLRPTRVSALSALPPRTSTTLTATDPDTVLHNLSDEQIVAHLRAQNPKPTLRKAAAIYKIGQPRAARLIKTATQQPTTEPEPTTEQNPDQKPEDQHSATNEECTSNEERNTHLGTTSEVGRPDSVRSEMPTVSTAPTGGGDIS